MNQQGIQMMALFTVELNANVRRFGFFIKPSSGHLFNAVSSELYLIQFLKMFKWKEYTKEYI